MFSRKQTSDLSSIRGHRASMKFRRLIIIWSMFPLGTEDFSFSASLQLSSYSTQHYNLNQVKHEFLNVNLLILL